MNINSILDNIGKVIVGKEDVTQKVLTSILAGGHVLLEDVPGTGKTMLAKSGGLRPFAPCIIYNSTIN